MIEKTRRELVVFGGQILIGECGQPLLQKRELFFFTNAGKQLLADGADDGRAKVVDEMLELHDFGHN